MLDFRPSWESGHATVREMEAQLPSIRTVMAGYEAAANAGLPIAYYVLLGDGHQAGRWELGVYGGDIARPAPVDPQRAGACARHWRRLVSRHDFSVQIKDCVTDKVVACG